MIILVMALFSLSAIYFTRLLSNKQMKVASLSVACLYIILITWTYTVFILDVASLGFSDTETQISLLTGSDIYHSFVNITDKLSVIPLELLEALLAVAVVAILAGFSVALHGVFEISRAIYRIICTNYIEKNKTVYRKHIFICKPKVRFPILRMNCRANC